MSLLIPFLAGCIIVGAVAAWERWGFPWGRH
jgi:hypothetical protein